MAIDTRATQIAEEMQCEVWELFSVVSINARLSSPSLLLLQDSGLMFALLEPSSRDL